MRNAPQYQLGMLIGDERPDARKRHGKRRNGERDVVGCVFDVQPDLTHYKEALIDLGLDWFRRVAFAEHREGPVRPRWHASSLPRSDLPPSTCPRLYRGEEPK